MRVRLFLLFLLVSFIGKTQKPQRVIFDSDMGPDYDDVGAIALLHAFADGGQARILATIASTKYDGVAGVFNVFNTYFNRPNIPIGVPKGAALTLRDWQHWSDTLLAHYPHHIKSNNDVPDATELYRKILADQPAGSVVIITVGFFTNLSNLLQSPPDQYSKLDGRTLVRRKVKRVVSMAGRFHPGKEFNIEKDAAAAKYVFEHWPTEIVCSSFEIGEKIKTGLPLVHNPQIQNSPVKDVFRICIPMAKEDSAGRMSWDETAVLYALLPNQPYYVPIYGKITVAEDGSNTWEPGTGKHAFLISATLPSAVQTHINTLMQHQPAKPRNR